MKEKKRHLIQALAALAQNAHLTGFFTGQIYQGDGKHVCVPGLNCYSCPGAVGACPIGSLQAVIGGRTRNVSYYVAGTILLFGVLFGRLICGFLCPFGFVQDLLHKIPSPKPKVPRRLDRPLRWGKYAALAAVLILPAVLTDPFGIGDPVFCKYVCPAGTLEGGIPLLAHSAALRAAAGFLFSWKLLLLVAVLTASVLVYRPFCKYLCPLGGAYGLLNRFSVCRMEVDRTACTRCGACTRACKMGVDVTGNINSAECIRCGLCARGCPTRAIHYTCGKAVLGRDAKRRET
ncbi:MAG: 4Fe-4S binding protein [Oscillibacter sp.]|nr:4Fe-4S binding protein [Oscillibacter sp.]